MPLRDDLRSIFQKVFFEDAGGLLTVCESDKNSELGPVRFHVEEGGLFHIKKEFLDASRELFIKDSDNPVLELDRVCDGIIAYKIGEKFYIFLIELKSKFTKDNIEKAYKQLRASYLKLVAALFPFKKFSCEDFHFCGVIVSLPISPETFTKYNKLRQVETGQFNYFDFCLKLSENKRIDIVCDHLKYKLLPLKEELYPDKMTFFYSDGADIDLEQYRQAL